jgi:predicted GIY-YIG superfamily endonuclease
VRGRWPRRRVGGYTSGEVYLLHFAERVGRAQHYVGWSRDPWRRLQQHRTGGGSVLTRMAWRRGIPVVLAATWPGTQADERALKLAARRTKTSFAAICPVCVAAARPTAPARQNFRLVRRDDFAQEEPTR